MEATRRSLKAEMPVVTTNQVHNPSLIAPQANHDRSRNFYRFWSRDQQSAFLSGTRRSQKRSINQSGREKFR